MPTPATLYYKSSGLNTIKLPVNYDTETLSTLGYKQMQSSVTFSDSACAFPIGKVFYDISILKVPFLAVNTVFDTELGYLFWPNVASSDDNTSSVQYTVALYDVGTPSILSTGTYNFPITGSSGAYAGMTENYVRVVVDSLTGLRTVSFVTI